MKLNEKGRAIIDPAFVFARYKSLSAPSSPVTQEAQAQQARAQEEQAGGQRVDHGAGAVRRWLAVGGLWIIKECNRAGAHVVHRTHQSDFTFIDQLSQHNTPGAEFLHGELNVFFRNGLDKLFVL